MFAQRLLKAVHWAKAIGFFALIGGGIGLVFLWSGFQPFATGFVAGFVGSAAIAGWLEINDRMNRQL